MGDSIAKPFCIYCFCSLFPPNSQCCCLLTFHYKVYRFLGIGRQSLGAGKKGRRRRPRRVASTTELIDPHRRRRMTSYCHWCSLEGAGGLHSVLSPSPNRFLFLAHDQHQWTWRTDCVATAMAERWFNIEEGTIQSRSLRHRREIKSTPGSCSHFLT